MQVCTSCQQLFVHLVIAVAGIHSQLHHTIAQYTQLLDATAKVISLYIGGSE